MPIAAAIGGSALLGAVVNRTAGKKAAKAQRRGQEAALAASKEATDLARSQMIPLFNAASENRQAGFQGALDMFGQTIPAQMQAFQGGNMNAQNTLLAGLDPQMQAILGGQIDLSGLQAQQVQAPDASMFQQQLPDFQTVNQALGISPSQAAGQQVGNFGNYGPQPAGNEGPNYNNMHPLMPSLLPNLNSPQNQSLADKLAGVGQVGSPKPVGGYY